MFKKEKGITLVALVITIVVLLILAGVAIASLTGNDNIINKAREARTAYEADSQNTETMLNDAMKYL